MIVVTDYDYENGGVAVYIEHRCCKQVPNVLMKLVVDICNINQLSSHRCMLFVCVFTFLYYVRSYTTQLMFLCMCELLKYTFVTERQL